MDKSTRFVAMHIAGHTYLFLYTPGREDDVVREASKFAADNELAFGWFHVAQIANQLRKYKKSGI